MAAFLFRAVNSAGKLHKGVIEAASATGARQALRERNLLPVSIEATAAEIGQPALSQPSLLDKLRPVINIRTLALITRQLSTLIGSDVRIEEALSIIAQQSASARAASVLLNLRAAIMDGRSFAQALADFPEVFSEFYRASIAAGEQSGKLAAVLLHLADSVEARQRNLQTVKLAMLYPALLLVVSLAIITLLLTYVVPDIVRVFTSRGADLPLLTRGLIAFSDGIRTYGWMVILALIVSTAMARTWLSKPANKLVFHRMISQGLLTRGISKQVNSAQFAGTLATLIQSGVPLLEALTAAGAVTPNHHIRAKIGVAAGRVREGSSLQDAIIEAGCFPPMLTAMVASGENSGNLGPALDRAATDQQRELDAWVSTLVALVEPAILLLMGGFVMLMVLAILLPIVDLNNLAGF